MNDENNIEQNIILNKFDDIFEINLIEDPNNNLEIKEITLNQKENSVINKEELLKEKSYYKLLLSDFKKFLKKINFQICDTDTSTVNKKSTNKSIIYNIVELHNNLYKNIKNIKKDLFYINNNYSYELLILDGENILKTYKYQQLIKLHLDNEIFENYFYSWYYGGENGLIQPLSSLNISIDDKIFLLNIFVTNYLAEYNTIIIISGKTYDQNSNKNIYINSKKTLIIPIIYTKEDIREQDDHLLLYIYFHFNKLKNCKIISADKFKWFNHSDNYLKNFKLEYDFNNYNINLSISNAYTNDLIIYKNYKYKLGYYYFPFIKNIDFIKNIKFNQEEIFQNKENFIDILFSFINEEKYSNVLIYLILIFINLIELNVNYNLNQNHINNFSELLTIFISKLIKNIKTNINQITEVIDKINLISKKAIDKIEKQKSNFLYTILFEKSNDRSNISSLTIDNYLQNNSSSDDNIKIKDTSEYLQLKKNIEKYFFLTEFYLILKSISFLVNSQKTIIKISKLFCYLVKIYDGIEENIYKIRKISNETNCLNKLFLNILSHHIFIKKNGFCKKDF